MSDSQGRPALKIESAGMPQSDDGFMQFQANTSVNLHKRVGGTFQNSRHASVGGSVGTQGLPFEFASIWVDDGKLLCFVNHVSGCQYKTIRGHNDPRARSSSRLNADNTGFYFWQNLQDLLFDVSKRIHRMTRLGLILCSAHGWQMDASHAHDSKAYECGDYIPNLGD